jgi:hypothetical protein
MRASLIGLPASCARVRENSSRRSAIACATRRKHALPLEGRQPPRSSERLDRGGDGRLGMLAPRLHHSSHNAAVEMAPALRRCLHLRSSGRRQRNRGLRLERSSFPPFFPLLGATALLIIGALCWLLFSRRRIVPGARPGPFWLASLLAWLPVPGGRSFS